jgi:hypothetical protein
VLVYHGQQVLEALAMVGGRARHRWRHDVRGHPAKLLLERVVRMPRLLRLEAAVQHGLVHALDQGRHSLHLQASTAASGVRPCKCKGGLPIGTLADAQACRRVGEQPGT